MSAPPERMHLARQWVVKAENDLRNARHTLTMGDDCPYDTVCFHAQQCAEKYLKAMLCHLGIDFPHIHDLGELVTLLPADNSWFPLSIDERERLSDYAVATRYPPEEETIERADAEDAVRLALRVREAVRARLAQRALD
jgi:HEPN domain-containing protein